jgi:hypothetical protein
MLIRYQIHFKFHHLFKGFIAPAMLQDPLCGKLDMVILIG